MLKILSILDNTRPKELPLNKTLFFLKLSFSEKSLILVILALLGISRLMSLVIKFKQYHFLLGIHLLNHRITPIITNEQVEKARRIGYLVRGVAKYTPWESKCLVQAITAKIILGFYQIPYGLFFGLTKDKIQYSESDRQAHSWVVSGPICVTGGRSSWNQFAVVASFFDKDYL